MIALKIAIGLLICLMASTFTFAVPPPPVNDDPCPVNNCTNNYSYCYIYSETGRQYCAPSCELNNGGCGSQICQMVTVQCFTAPCPPIVECLSAAEVCNLPPAVGVCDAAFQRFFFNSTSRRCEVFIYGGCGGNGNNFANQTDCERICQSDVSRSVMPTSTSRSSTRFLSTSASKSSRSTIRPTPTVVQVCNLPPAVGDCDAAIPRFFFNSISRRCEMFTYGVCGGNENNFVNRTDCERACRPVDIVLMTVVTCFVIILFNLMKLD